MANKLKLLDLFAGLGGFSLGLERTGGFQTIAFCEIEKFPQKVLRKHWPNVPIYEDVRTLSADKLRADGISVDCIAGGFPCQDVSLAGKGAGLKGERSGLWFEFHRLIKEIKPSWVIIENVSALRSRGLDEVLRSLFEIGYDAEWNCIPASAVGAPHQRDRIWIVAYPNRTDRGTGRDAEYPSDEGRKPSSTWREIIQSQDGQPRSSDIEQSGQNVADSNSIRQSCEGILWSFINAQRREGEVHRTSDGGSDAAQVADSYSTRLERQSICSTKGKKGDWVRDVGTSSSDVSNTMCKRLQGQLQGSKQAERPIREERQSVSSLDSGISRTNDEGPTQSLMGRMADGFSRGMDGSRLGDIWAEEPDIPRVAQGVKNRVQRLKALGNAVVPQIPELIGYAILNSMERHHDG